MKVVLIFVSLFVTVVEGLIIVECQFLIRNSVLRNRAVKCSVFRFYLGDTRLRVYALIHITISRLSVKIDWFVYLILCHLYFFLGESF